MAETPEEEIRRAATLMRERATAATPGPWKAHGDHSDWFVVSEAFGLVSTGVHEEPEASIYTLIERDRRDAEHMAGMHPLVALAVAGWLDAEAGRAGGADGIDVSDLYPRWLGTFSHPLAIARAYLREAGNG